MVKNKEYFIFKSWKSVLGKSELVKERLAKKSLLTFLSYQLPESSKHDIFIGFRELYRVIKRKKNKPEFNENINLILDGSVKTENLRVNYLEQLGYSQLTFVGKLDLLTYRDQISLISYLKWFLKSIKWSFDVLFVSENRVNKALFIRSLLEHLVAVNLVDQINPKNIHDFVQYEPDSNLFYLVIKDIFGDELTYIKYPSPGPLRLHNSILLTDILAINHPYHKFEVEHLADIIYREIKLVPVECYFTYSHCYEEVQLNPKFTIGYYSHASWLRKEEGHADDGLGIAAAEENLLIELARFLNKHSSISLKIFTHPRERSIAVDSKTRLYYHKFFNSSQNVVFATSNEKSDQAFNQVRIGLGVYSTILFERLICGFPTLFLSPDPSFPMQGSNLDNIVIELDELTSRLEREIENHNFMDSHGLSDYVYALK